MSTLPILSFDDLAPTRDYLQDVAKVLGKLQQAFLPVEPHDWQRGLTVNLRGLITQPFLVANEETRASIDLVKYKVRLDGSNWLLEEYAPPEIMKDARAWLESRGLQVHIEEPEYSKGRPRFDASEADKYAEALWWMYDRFEALRRELSPGLVSPVLLFPHHFDLSLTWFPRDESRQLGLGWSTGDKTIPEPYLYITAYPEPAGFMDLPLPPAAFWNQKDFSGAILRYNDLARAAQPEELFKSFAGLLTQAAPLFAR